MYLVAIMDWASRKVLSWRLSNTLDTSFCLDALEEAIYLYDKPDIFNTDQGSQFTSPVFTNISIDNDIKISMDGKGRALANIYIERLRMELALNQKLQKMESQSPGKNLEVKTIESTRIHDSIFVKYGLKIQQMVWANEQYRFNLDDDVK